MRTRAVVAFLVLHAVTAAPFPWERGAGTLAWLQPSADLLVLLAAVCVLRQATPRMAMVLVTATLLTCLVPLYRFGETLMPPFYGKAFEPWIDLLELPGLLHLVSHRQPLLVRVLMATAALATAAVTCWGLARAWRSVAAACAAPRTALTVLLACQGLTASAWCLAETSGGAIRLLRPSMLLAALDDVAATVHTRRWHGDEVVSERVRAAAAELAATPQDLGRLAGTDVFLLILESYGRGILDGRARPTWETWLNTFEAELRGAGWEAAAGWIAPSVRGGGSSLAHAELLCGVPVEDRRVFDGLLASDVRSLAAIARDAGYLTVDVQPAMPRPWPEARALGFAQDMFQSAFPYAGRPYHWGVMPDQFALAHLLGTVVAGRTRPLFVQYVSVTSHAPFSMVPPYHADWTAATRPDAFSGEPAARWDIGWTTYAGHPAAEEAYLETIRYSLRTAFGFVHQLRAPAVVVVVGDHQPPLDYPERSDRLYDVPIHVVTNRPELLVPLCDQGLRKGLVPATEAASFKAARFLFRFLRAYGGS